MKRNTYKRVYIIALLAAVLLLVQGCGKEDDAEQVQVIGFDELETEGLASWRIEDLSTDSVDVDEIETDEEEISEENDSEEEELSFEESMESNGWAHISENQEFVICEDTKYLLERKYIIKDNVHIQYDNIYGHYYDAYLLEPSEGRFYLLLEVWDYEQYEESSLLLYELKADEVILCQAIYGGRIKEVISSDTVKLRQLEPDLGLTATRGTYFLDTDTNTLVSLDEWKEVSGYLYAKEKDIPVMINGEQTVIPVGTSAKKVKSNLQGHIVFEIEDTGVQGDFYYEKDENGRFFIAGEPAGAYFEDALVTYHYAPTLQERSDGLTEAGEGGVAVMFETVEQGERYSYHITDYCINMEGFSEKRVIEVYEGDRPVQTIEQDWPTFMDRMATESRVWEKDADFDGVTDIIFFDCYTGNQGAALYSCYLARGSKFVECESFYGIFNPRYQDEYDVISSFSRGSSVSHSMSYYRYDGTEFVLFREDEYEVEESIGERIMVNAHPFWNYMMLSEDLSEEEWIEMQRFYPVFCKGKELTLWYGAEKEAGVTTFSGISEMLVEEKWPELSDMYEFVFADLTGDGQKELIMRCSDLGSSVFVLLEDDGKFYVSYFGIRSMQFVLEDGMYYGSGGAGIGGYWRLHFENGKFREEEVNYEEFLLGEDEHAANEVEWNAALVYEKHE